MGNKSDSSKTELQQQSYQHQDAGPPVVASPDKEEKNKVTNEYVLNVAFWTFLGFLLLEAVFAIIAGSQSMLEDAEAMSVDAITYLFNLCAERIKNRPYSAKELEMPVALRDYRRERLRLYLELVPPLISVVTLIIVTVLATQDAIEDLTCDITDDDCGGDDDVDVNIMLWFSGANLLLDLVNVGCFARANQAVGISIAVQDYTESTRYAVEDMQHTLEMEGLLLKDETEDDDGSEASYDFNGKHVVHHVLVNLNMCSAWTVRAYLRCEVSQIIFLVPSQQTYCFFSIAYSALCYPLSSIC